MEAVSRLPFAVTSCGAMRIDQLTVYRISVGLVRDCIEGPTELGACVGRAMWEMPPILDYWRKLEFSRSM